MNFDVITIDIDNNVNSVDSHELSNWTIFLSRFLYFELKTKANLDSVHVNFCIPICVHKRSNVIMEIVASKLGSQFVAI